MKIRTDFVTNSSSSSFIIGKKDDDVTIDTVYQKIRELYISHGKSYNEMIDYAMKKYPVTLENGDIDGVAYKELIWDKNDKSYNDFDHLEVCWDLEDKFGCDMYSRLCDEKWLDCKTYQEYQDYWIDVMESSDKGWHPYAPFTIFDYSQNIPVIFLHYGKDGLKYNNDRGNSIDENLNWYFNYIEDAFKGIKYDDSMYIERGRYELYQKMIETEKIPEDKACLYLLGKICVESECGYMPEYVVNGLRKISQFSCNHMG